jgi:hypothetical protein
MLAACPAGRLRRHYTWRNSSLHAFPSSSSCGSHATNTAEAWISGNQVVGTIHGAPVATLSSFTYPLGVPHETSEPRYSVNLANLAWAPDAKHLAVNATIAPGDMAPYTYPYVVDTSSHAVTRVVLPGDIFNSAYRNLAWVDNQTLLILTGDTPGGGAPGSVSGGVYSYNLETRAVSVLPGISHVSTAGVVRCGVLFYLEVTPFGPSIGVNYAGSNVFKGSARLHRYSLASHSEIGSPVTISQTYDTDGSFGFYFQPGWDVASDGLSLVYQYMDVHVGSSAADHEVRSHFLKSGVDGSGAAVILSGAHPVTSYTGASVAISPDSRLVAVTGALPSPRVATGDSGGGSVRYYTPDAFEPSAWLSDSSGFDAGVSSAAGEDIERYLLSTGLDPRGRTPGRRLVRNARYPAALA